MQHKLRTGRKWISGVVLAIFLSGIGGIAQAVEITKVVPIGKAIGIEMSADGVMVVTITGVQTNEGEKHPAKDAGLQQGDIIQSANGEKIDSNETLQKVVKKSSDGNVKLGVLRNGAKKELDLHAVKDTTENLRIGVMVRDSIAGIGTITFVTPETKQFASLGHAICDVETGALLPLADGNVMEASITHVVKGQVGTPGELQGDFNMLESVGRLSKNTLSGIYGQLSDDRYYRNLSEVALVSSDEAHSGSAKVLCNLSGESVQSYDINIMEIFDTDEEIERGMMIEVTDPALLEQTGGIVQGMSGSPILQDGHLIGAVTHVLVNDPTKGYAIFAEKMLAELRN